MVREAAVLGVPAYSYFKGRTGNVDTWLEKQGRLIMLRTPDEVAEKLRVTQKTEKDAYQVNVRLVADIAQEILETARSDA